MIYALAVFLPLIAAILAGFFGRWLKDRGAQLVTCGAMVLSALISCYLLYDVAFMGNTASIRLFSWMRSDAFEVDWALRVDQLTASPCTWTVCRWS